MNNKGEIETNWNDKVIMNAPALYAAGEERGKPRGGIYDIKELGRQGGGDVVGVVPQPLWQIYTSYV